MASIVANLHLPPLINGSNSKPLLRPTSKFSFFSYPGRHGRMLAAVKAAGEGADSSTSLVESIQNVWEKPEDRVAVVGLGLTAIIALWASVNFISAVDKLPVIPGFFEFVGILYSSWFVYRYLLFKPEREELFRNVNNSISNILGQ